MVSLSTLAKTLLGGLGLATATALSAQQPVPPRSDSSLVAGPASASQIMTASPRIGLAAGTTLRSVVAPGTKLAIPIAIDMSAAAGGNLAALTTGISWPTARLTFDSLKSGGFGSLTPNLGSTGSGSASMSIFSATGTTANQTLATLYLTATSSQGGASVSLSPSAAGNETGGDLLAQLRTRGIDICVASAGLWGDVNGDNAANIIDAQQIARSTVGLSVVNASLVASQGDVNADNAVNIIDAQQIARFTVGLSAAARINTSLFTTPTVGSVTLSAASATLNAGETVQLGATPKDGSAASVAGCVPVTWSSANTAVATVDSTGLVTAVASGSTTVTATAGGQNASATITVAGAPVTGLSISLTAPAATTRFIAIVDGGGLAQPIINRLTVANTTTGTMTFAVPVATGYNVRLYAAHPGSSDPDNAPIIASSALVTGVAVTAGNATPITKTLAAVSAVVTPSATTATLGTPITYTFSVTDSTQVLYLNSQGSCAQIYVNAIAGAGDFSAGAGSGSNCTMTRPQTAVYSWAGNIQSIQSAGTMYYQLGASRFVSNSTTGVNLWFLTPSVSRGEALNTVVYSVGSSHVLKLALSQARPAKMYVVDVTGNGLPDIVSATLSGSNMTSGTVTVRVPNSGTYTIRAFALDAAASFSLFGGGVSGSVNVDAVADTTTVSAPLTPAVFTTSAMPTVVSVNATIQADYTIADPSGISSAGGNYCGTVRYSTSTFTGDFFGSSANMCTVSTPVFGTRRYTGTVPAQLSAGTLNYNMGGYTTYRVGMSDQGVYFFSPSVARGETPATISVVQVATVNVTPATPTVPVGGTQNMAAAALNGVGGTITGLPVTWATSDANIATVSSTGVVAGVANGTATISATIGGVTGSTTVTVSGGLNVGSITVALSNGSLSGNATTTATPTVRDPSNNIISATVSWSSSNRLVARVGTDGTVQALGPGTAQITATIGGVSGSATVTVSAVTQQFAITMRNMSTLSAGVQAAFTAAATRWAQVVRGDLPDVPFSNFDVSGCLSQAANTTVLNETVDDVLIYVNVGTIDGVGNILGQAGPCLVRSGGLPVIGTMTFDSADLANMEANGTLNAVILHEMGHVLGIGTRWGSLLTDPAPSSPDPAGDPIFTGANGIWGFNTLNTGYGGRVVPVENCCSQGTRNAHWREAVLQRELMTGFVSQTGQPNPLSPLTVGSLLDLGYVVDMSQADAQPWYVREGPEPPQVEIREGIVPEPIIVDANGKPVQPRSIQGPAAPPPPM